MLADESRQVDKGRRARLLALFTLIHAANAVCYTGISPLSPFIEADLGFNKTQVGGISSAFSIGVMVASVFTGWLIDRFGIRRMLVAGQLGVAAAMIGLTLFPGFRGIICAAFLVGVFYSVLNPCSNKGVTKYFSVRTRATAMGVKQMGVAAGGAIAAAVMPVVAVSFGWRGTICYTAGIIILIAIFTYCCYQDVDYGCFGSGAWQNLRFVLRERKLFLVSLNGMILTGVQLTLIAYFVLFCHDVMCIDVPQAGILMSAALTAGAAGRVGWGALSDRAFHGNRQQAMIVICLTLCCSALLAASLHAGSARLLLPVLAVLLGGAGVGWNGLLMAMMAEYAPPGKVGTTSGFCLAAFYGGFFIPPVFGRILDHSGSYPFAWGFIGAVSLLLLVVNFAWMRSLRTKTAAQPQS